MRLQIEDSTVQVGENEHVQQALLHVRPRYRACLLLQIEVGLPQREIAALLHLREKSISVYVQRGCEQFRRAYAQLAVDATRPTEGSRIR